MKMCPIGIVFKNVVITLVRVTFFETNIQSNFILKKKK